MFEWNWDSIATECTGFLGPNGYGYVQGKVKKSSISQRFEPDETMPSPCSLLACSFLSEPCDGTYPRYPMVDGLSGRLVQPHVQTRQSSRFPEHDHHMSRGGRQSHSW